MANDKKGDWLKLHRSILDWEWYSHKNTRLLFLHLLLIVNFAPRSVKGITIPAGSIDRTQEQLMRETGLTRQQLRCSLNNLKTTKEITITKHGKFSVISIVRWDEYQCKQPKNNQEINQETTKEQPKNNHLNKNIKNIKNAKEDIGSASEEEEDIYTEENGWKIW